MDHSTNPHLLSPNKSAAFVFILVGYFISFFLYYIDEGNYHFKGLVNPFEWIFVTMSALIFMVCFWLVYFFLRKTKLPFFLKLLIAVILGIFVIPLILFLVQYCFRIQFFGTLVLVGFPKRELRNYGNFNFILINYGLLKALLLH